MRKFLNLLLAASLGLAAVGCGGGKEFDGPTVDAFNGKLTSHGKPVSFPAGEEVTLKLFHETGQSFGIPIQSDGSFKIGWMPIGKYSATVIREPKAAKAGPNRHTVPGGLTVEDGKTEYTIDLGKNWKS
jgi:hypothetical protein